MTETRACQNCKKDFTIEPDDFAFYEKIQVPPPTFCPECRLLRRLLWRNERALYKRSCDLCKKQIIAMYPAEATFPVYCRPCWFSDSWDATSYARDYDFSRPFFEQFRDLLAVVPQIATQVDKSMNSDYCNQIVSCKNCYLVVGASQAEDSMYSYRVILSTNILDSLVSIRCKKLYESMQCVDSAQLNFSDRCLDSLSLDFCYDVRGSQDCFMTSNLRHKKYYFRNFPYSKEEYTEKLKAIDTGSYTCLEALKNEFNNLRKRSINRYMLSARVDNVSGDSISDCKNCRLSFFVGNSENIKYCVLTSYIRDSYDLNNGIDRVENCYEVSTLGVGSYDIKFSADLWPDARQVEYSQACRNGVANLFGCIGLRKKQYCVLNRQYSKEEYEVLLSRIKEQMKNVPYVDAQGRIYAYGEFFPFELSPFAYNETAAKDFMNLTSEQIALYGMRVRDEERGLHTATLKSKSIPDHIKEISDEILKEVIECAHHGSCGDSCPGVFRVTPSELQFYRQMNIALPRLCPNCRHYERFRSRNPLKLWHRQCMKNGCVNEFETSYSPDRPDVVYCESCYNAEVV
jgi:hypothetical protein